MNAIYQRVRTHLHSDIHMKGFTIAVQSAANVRINMQSAVGFFYIKARVHYLVQEKPC